MSHIRITLLSETTFGGTQASRGWVDTEVEINPYTQLPELGGKTLHGLLVDTWEGMSLAFQESAPVAHRLLGQTASVTDDAVLHIGKAQLALSTRLSQLHKSTQPLSLSRIRFQTAIDRAAGSARDQTLRTSQVLVEGLVFCAPVTWLETPNESDLDLLQLLCKLTRHVGYARNRGRGHVKLEYVHNEKEFPSPKAVPRPIIQGPKPWLYVPLTLTLQASVIASTPGLSANEALSLGYIPGSMVRGAIAGLCANDPESLRQLVLSGQVRFLNAYPELTRKKRSQPIWLNYRTEKKSAHSTQLYDILASGLPDIPLRKPPYQFQHPRPGTSVLLGNARKHIKVHHARDRLRGRAVSGNIFAYESLVENQSFLAMLQIGAQDWQGVLRKLTELLQKPLTLGRSRRAEYGGLARGEVGAPRHHEYEEPKAIQKDQWFACCLTSPYVGRNEWGQHDPASIKRALERLFQGKAKLQTMAWNYRLIGGFNRKWATELPQVLALEEGSVVWLQAIQDLDAEFLSSLMHEGLGERLEDGFGRFVIVPVDPGQQPGQGFEVQELSLQDDLQSNCPPDAYVEERILRRTFWQVFEVKLLEKLHDLQPLYLPAASLLGRLRSLLKEDSTEDLYDELEEMKASAKKAYKALTRCKVEVVKQRTLHECLCYLTRPSSNTDDLLDWLDLKQTVGTLGNVNQKLLEGLSQRMHSRVTHELLWFLAKQAKQERRGQA